MQLSAKNHKVSLQNANLLPQKVHRLSFSTQSMIFPANDFCDWCARGCMSKTNERWESSQLSSSLLSEFALCRGLKPKIGCLSRTEGSWEDACLAKGGARHNTSQRLICKEFATHVKATKDPHHEGQLFCQALWWPNFVWIKLKDSFFHQVPNIYIFYYTRRRLTI